jgi:hypothetical protein
MVSHELDSLVEQTEGMHRSFCVVAEFSNYLWSLPMFSYSAQARHALELRVGVPMYFFA